MMDWFPGVPFHSRMWTVIKRADWLEMAFLLYFAFAAAIQLFSNQRPGSISELMPGWIKNVWLTMLLIGAVVAIVGNLWLWKRTDSLLIESTGDLAVGISVFLYGASVFVFGFQQDAPGAVIMSGPIVMMLGAGWVWKWRRLNEVLNALRGK